MTKIVAKFWWNILQNPFGTRSLQVILGNHQWVLTKNCQEILMKYWAKSLWDMSGESQKIFVKSLWRIQGKSLCVVPPIIARWVSLQLVNWIIFSCYFKIFSSHGKQKKVTWKVLNNFSRKKSHFATCLMWLKMSFATILVYNATSTEDNMFKNYHCIHQGTLNDVTNYHCIH